MVLFLVNERRLIIEKQKLDSLKTNTKNGSLPFIHYFFNRGSVYFYYIKRSKVTKFMIIEQVAIPFTYPDANMIDQMFVPTILKLRINETISFNVYRNGSRLCFHGYKGVFKWDKKKNFLSDLAKFFMHYYASIEGIEI